MMIISIPGGEGLVKHTLYSCASSEPFEREKCRNQTDDHLNIASLLSKATLRENGVDLSQVSSLKLNYRIKCTDPVMGRARSTQTFH